MFGCNEVSMSDLEPRKAPEPMSYIEPPCKPKVPEVSLLVNNSLFGSYDNTGGYTQPKHFVLKIPFNEESYNAWKWRQSNSDTLKQATMPPHQIMGNTGVPPESSPHSAIQQTTNGDNTESYYSDACRHSTKHFSSLPPSSGNPGILSANENGNDFRNINVTGNRHVTSKPPFADTYNNFSPNDIGSATTHLYTPIGESTPLQGILRNNSRNPAVYDNTHKISHRVSYQPDQLQLPVTQEKCISPCAKKKEQVEDIYISEKNANQLQYLNPESSTYSKLSGKVLANHDTRVHYQDHQFNTLKSSNILSQTELVCTTVRNSSSAYPKTNADQGLLKENCSTQRNILPEKSVFQKHMHGLQSPQHNYCIIGNLGNKMNQEYNQDMQPHGEHSLTQNCCVASAGLGGSQTVTPKYDCHRLQGVNSFRDGCATANSCRNFTTNGKSHIGCTSNTLQSPCANHADEKEVYNIFCHGDGGKSKRGVLEDQIYNSSTGSKTEVLAVMFHLLCAQNEQLEQLKTQVEKLLQKFECTHFPEQVSKSCTQDVAIQTENVCSYNQEKVSIGVMTTVEPKELSEEHHVQSSSQQKVQRARGKFQGQQQQQHGTAVNSSCQCNFKSNPAVDETINFNSVKLQTIHEPVPSPMSSMHVDMHDYQSEDEDCEASTRQRCCDIATNHNSHHLQQQQQTEDGNVAHWTFYRNVMQQVNKLMNDTEKNTANSNEDPQKKIQMATFKELVHMGVSICDAASAVGDKSLLFDSRLNVMALNSDMKEPDAKLQINTEALKYLDEQVRQTDMNAAGDKKTDCTLFLKTANLSFTALRYLQQNHGNGTTEPIDVAVQSHRSPAAREGYLCHHHCSRNHNDAPPSKVLDITMLKQQPKLL